jgi:hypothetical protein
MIGKFVMNVSFQPHRFYVLLMHVHFIIDGWPDTFYYYLLHIKEKKWRKRVLRVQQGWMGWVVYKKKKKNKKKKLCVHELTNISPVNDEDGFWRKNIISPCVTSTTTQWMFSQTRDFTQSSDSGRLRQQELLYF